MSHLWGITSFFIHQSRSTNVRRSGFYHQTQALLRNAESSASMLWTLLKIIQRWRSKEVGAIRGSLALMASAVSHLALLTAATILSSQVLSAGDEVQVRGDQCGWMTFNGTQDDSSLQLDFSIASGMVATWTADQVQKYANACYNNATSLADSATCKFYTRNSLPLAVDGEVPCPFSSRICGTQKAMHVDTGYIDSQRDLGINTPPESAIRFRKTLTCAPILAEERFSSGNWSTNAPANFSTIPGDRYWYYYLGPSQNGNFTWVMNEFSLQSWTAPPYGLGCSLFNQVGPSGFQPIPDLQVNNSDLTLLFLTNTAVYPQKVDDPWYNATGSEQLEDGQTIFFSNRVLSTMACMEQYQFCNATACAALNGLNAYLTNNSGILQPGTPELNLNDVQKGVLNLVWSAAQGTTIFEGVGTLGTKLLVAQQYLINVDGSNRVSAPLPSTLWQDEVRNMANLMLAGLQRIVLDFVSPPDIPVTTVLRGTVSARDYITDAGPEFQETKAICNSVRIRDGTAYYNFSVAGLCVILSVGSAVMLINTFCVPNVVFWIRRRILKEETHSRCAKQAWLESHWLYLLRAVSERGKNGGVRWDVEKDGGIPVTRGNTIGFRGTDMWGPLPEKCV
ncbi:hypothetical protein QBC47DRAFT_405025 [Echria macrotheca]|uniref:Uncharacterized protein n=1 Tax=Echria macrotheca TaxID=438768 RepID=A0AAJ0B7L9_9PEZI|nr:hypothetical protein QBC47DRAFT_405025 [Echria macrotheca]